MVTVISTRLSGLTTEQCSISETPGPATAPVFVQQTGSNNPFNGVNVGLHADPTFADLDGDGDLDAVVGGFFGDIFYFRNTGTATAPVFVQQIGSNNPFNGVVVGGAAGRYSAPTFADLDGDGDPDAVVGINDGTLHYFRNTGTPTAPVFVEQTGSSNPFNGIIVGAYSNPTLADLDGDGDLDAVVGIADGTLHYFRNTGTTAAPVFVEQISFNNPFNGVDVGDFSAPNLADLDGDGRLDAVVGINDGTLHYLRNTSSITVNVTAVNDAPISSNDLVTTNEDVTVVLGLGDFGTYADVEGSALAAVRITTLESNGALQYDTTGGGAWIDVTLNQQISASDISAGRLRFVPDATENGTPYATIGFQVSDGTDFSVSAYTLTVNVTGVNNAPVLDASKSPAGAAVAEDAAVPVGAVGTLVSALIDFASPSGQVDNVTDADAGALTGIAITAADTSNGSWFYSTNGTTWTALGALSDSTALLLAADADNRLYFRPNANYDGQANITFRAWDQSSGSDGGTANTTSNGSGTAFSTATDTATFDVTPVNDAPIVNGPNTASLKEDTVPQWGSGQLTATDVDQGPTPLVWSIQSGTPSLQDYQFAIDQFKIIRNGSTFFDDTFGDGNAPPSAPNFVGGSTTAYNVTGAFFEAAGRAALYGVNAITLSNINGNPSVGQLATLQTNVDPLNTTLGLKVNMDFTVEGRFDLVIPKDVREQYGIRLTDSLSGQPGDNTVSLSVRRDADGVHVSLNELNFVTGTSTVLQSITLAPLPGDNQITLRLSHSAASPGIIVASFDLFNNGVLTSTTNFTSTGHVFDNENWVSAQFLATGAPEDDTQLAGTYARLTISQDGEWTANVRNGQPAVQALAEGQTVQEIFYVTVTDDQSVTTLQPITVTVTGTNDVPILTGDLSITVSNGGTVVLTQDDIFALDPDITDVLTFTVSDQVHGQVRVNGIATSTFTHQQLLSGVVTFVHDGFDASQAGFKISISDGLAATSTVTVLAAVPTIRVAVQSADGFNFNDGEPIEKMGAGTIQVGATATQYMIVNVAANLKFVFEGVGFTFAGGSSPTDVTGGIINSIHVFRNSDNAALFDFIGNIGAAAWHDAVVAAAGGDNSLIEALSRDWTFAFAGNIGSDIGDIAGDGNDFFRVSGGNDLLDGQSRI